MHQFSSIDEDLSNFREIGDEASSWKLSSGMKGYGIKNLRDNNDTTFWHSQGQSPHTITIEFLRKRKIAKVGLGINYQLDHNYTPKLIRIRASVSAYEDEIIHEETIDRDCIWKMIDLKPHSRQYLGLKKYNKQKQKQKQKHNNKRKRGNLKLKSTRRHNDTNINFKNKSAKPPKYLKTNRLIIEIVTCHDQGYNTHIRQVKIWGPYQYNRDIFELPFAKPTTKNISPIVSETLNVETRYCSVRNNNNKNNENDNCVDNNGDKNNGDSISNSTSSTINTISHSSDNGCNGSNGSDDSNDSNDSNDGSIQMNQDNKIEKIDINIEMNGHTCVIRPNHDKSVKNMFMSDTGGNGHDNFNSTAINVNVSTTFAVSDINIPPDYNTINV